jgi:FtsZ-interacting cell division protein ZipA
MTTSQIIWIVVIAVGALVLIGLIVALMRKKSHAEKHEKAELLRERADVEAAGLPDARARAEQAATEAERARLEAQRAEERAAAVRAEADQQRAIHEERIRAADRLDPDVDTRAKDYSPDVVDPAGPSNVPADPAYADPDTGRASVRHRLEGDAPEEPDVHPEETGGTHRT